MTDTDQGQRAVQVEGADSAGHPAGGPGPGSVGGVVTRNISGFQDDPATAEFRATVCVMLDRIREDALSRFRVQVAALEAFYFGSDEGSRH